MRVCVRVCMRVCVSVCMSVCMRVYVCVYLRVRFVFERERVCFMCVYMRVSEKENERERERVREDGCVQCPRAFVCFTRVIAYVGKEEEVLVLAFKFSPPMLQCDQTIEKKIDLFREKISTSKPNYN